jgi:hypothetical protein
MQQATAMIVTPSNKSLEGPVNGLGVRAAGAEEIVRPRRLIGHF